MREIKFRIWNGTRFVTKADTYIKTSDGSLWDYKQDYGGTFSSHEKLWSADGKIQQFTGIKDKNGVEIYEGDIIKIKMFEKWTSKVPFESYHVVFYNSERASFVHAKDPNTFPHGIPFDQHTYLELESEVIGNIFENPELLEQ